MNCTNLHDIYYIYMILKKKIYGFFVFETKTMRSKLGVRVRTNETMDGDGGVDLKVWWWNAMRVSE